MVKGRALARPSERSERFEPLVRPDLRCAVVRATQSEKTDTAELKLLCDKFNFNDLTSYFHVFYSDRWVLARCGVAVEALPEIKMSKVPNEMLGLFSLTY